MSETKMPNEDVRAEIILYQSDGQDVPVQVHLMDDTLWMPQREIADLFETSQQNVSLRRGIVSLEDVSAAMRYLAPSLRAVLDLIRESGGAAVLPMSGELRELVDRRLLRASEGPAGTFTWSLSPGVMRYIEEEERDAGAPVVAAGNGHEKKGARAR